MFILLTNDDGIYAPGLAALEKELGRLGDVCVVAPATEQSGVGHSITYLTPLITKEVFINQCHWGWAVEGSPADCVKIGISEFCPRRPDLVVSGINGGLNAGINVLYSGTVAAAIEGAFFGITSVAVSLEFDENARFDRAAQLAVRLIEQLLKQKGPQAELYNLNIPTVATQNNQPVVKVVPMDVTPYGEQFEKRVDPAGRVYYWATGYPQASDSDNSNDLSALTNGFVTLTPLDYNMTRRAAVAEMGSWRFQLDPADETSDASDAGRPSLRMARQRE